MEQEQTDWLQAHEEIKFNKAEEKVMEHSEQITEIIAALCKAQSELESVKKEAANEYFNSKYSTLDKVWSTAKPVLTKYGLAVSQLMGSLNGKQTVITFLFHNSGQFLRSEMLLNVANQTDPQALGSAISYARRYSLMAILSLPSADDDGNAGGGKTKRQEYAETRQAVKQWNEGKPIGGKAP